MAVAKPLRDQLIKLSNELDTRQKQHRLQDRYYCGDCPLPEAIVRARVTKAYRMLMPMAEAPWGSLVVDSVQDRLEVAGILSPDESANEAVWGAWQDNQMDAESKLAHNAALISGRAFALVWPEPGTAWGEKPPEISLDSSEQMIVQYRSGSRRHRVGALRRWTEDDRSFAALYRHDGVYKFAQSLKANQSRGMGRFKVNSEYWEALEAPDERWPLENPLGIVPVVELAVNRRLKPGEFAFARGEYQHCTGLIDRINLLSFLGLVVAFWMGFPLRGVIGDKIAERILTDDDGQPLLDSAGQPRTELEAPFDALADTVFQLENPDAKLAEYKAADRKNLSVLEELDQLATITKTPRHYFPMASGMNNLAADAIRASEGGLASKVVGHKGSLGDGWLEVNRLCGRALPEPVLLPQRAQLLWKDHEARSMAERADAAVKLKDILPWQLLAERYLNLSQDDIRRAEAMPASDVLTQLVNELKDEPPPLRAAA